MIEKGHRRVFFPILTLALKYGGFNIHNDVKEKLAVSSTVYITIHDFIVTAQQQPQPHAVGMRLPPPLTHHHSIACYKKHSVLIVCG